MAATATSTSSLMLTYASSSPLPPQDFIAHSLYFKPKPLFRTFSLYPLVLQARERRPSSDGPYDVVVAALAAEAEVAEAVEEVEGGEGVAVSAAPPPKPKKGKAALPLKRDRVCLACFGFSDVKFGLLGLICGYSWVSHVDVVSFLFSGDQVRVEYCFS